MVISLPLQLAKKEIRPGIFVLEVAGAIHMGPGSQRIEQEVDQMLARGENKVILDFSKVTFVDSGGLGAIVRCYSKIKKSGGALRFAGVQGMITTVIKITQVDKLIENYPTATEAAGSFPPEGQAGA